MDKQEMRILYSRWNNQLSVGGVIVDIKLIKSKTEFKEAHTGRASHNTELVIFTYLCLGI